MNKGKRFLYFLFVLQRRKHIDCGLCECFDINKSGITYCNRNHEKTSLKKRERNYCFPLDNGNCVIRKMQKEALPKVYFLTAKGLLLE